MRRLLLPLLMACAVPTAQADLITFNFNSLSETANAAAISSYMSGVYGSSITVQHAFVGQNPVGPPSMPDPTGKVMADNSIRSFGTGYPFHLDIYLNEVPITGMRFEGFAFPGLGPLNLQLRAYDDATAVYSQSWDRRARQPVFSDWIDFRGQAVNHLWFSNAGRYDIGIDNLTVSHTPVPAAVWLGVLGLGAAGLKLRKFARVIHDQTQT